MFGVRTKTHTGGNGRVCSDSGGNEFCGAGNGAGSARMLCHIRLSVDLPVLPRRKILAFQVAVKRVRVKLKIELEFSPMNFHNSHEKINLLLVQWVRINGYFFVQDFKPNIENRSIVIS